MPTLHVRNVPKDLHERIQALAQSVAPSGSPVAVKLTKTPVTAGKSPRLADELYRILSFLWPPIPGDFGRGQRGVRPLPQTSTS